MIITKDILNNKIDKEIIPTCFTNSINLYVNIKDKGLVLYNINPTTWNCLYPFYQQNNLFLLNNYTLSNTNITYKELLEEYQTKYKEIYENKEGYTKDKRKQLLINEYKNTFNIDSIIIKDELEPYYELKYSKTKKVWTLYYFENYVVNSLDNIDKLLNQKIYPQEFIKLDSNHKDINGVSIVSGISYILSIDKNIEILNNNQL